MHWGTMLRWMSALAFVTAGGTACSDDETAPSGHANPVAATLVIDGETFTQNETIVLVAGETVNAEIRLLDEHGDVITGIENEHFVKLNVTPTELVTTVDVPENHFQKTVTAQGASGMGSFNVGYGHDAAADEQSFGPFEVAVVVPST